jgi:thioredoxin reductase (NADPH)
MFFARYASKVTVLVRGEGLQKSMSSYLIDQIAGTPNIELWTHKQIAEAKGDDRLRSLVIEDTQTGERQEIPAAAVFIFIGAQPRSELVSEIVQRSEKGFVATGGEIQRKRVGDAGPWTLEREPMPLETSVPGIFAAGDVRDGSSKRVAAAVGEGSVAVQMIHRYLKTV